jgi:hypothetical protein
MHQRKGNGHDLYLTIIAKQLMRLHIKTAIKFLTIPIKMIVKLTLVFLIMFFANIFCNKLVYIDHVIKGRGRRRSETKWFRKNRFLFKN